MTDYIKRDIERIIANAQECDIDALIWEEQKERLKAVKSADVAPVRHGRWITDWNDGLHMCSICGETIYVESSEELSARYKYCNRCGAKMDEEE